MVSWITYATDTEPYSSMAKRLAESVDEAKAGVCHIVDLNPNGSNLFAEALGRGYELMSDFIDEGPVIFIDADCIVRKPVYDLFETRFIVAAVHRGKVATSMGRQDFISCLACFHPHSPNLARHLWLRWAELTMNMAINKPQVEKQKHRNDSLTKAGWLANWCCDQTSFNEILFEMEERNPSDVLRLNRDEYAARPNIEDPYIIHYKGGRKLQT